MGRYGTKQASEGVGVVGGGGGGGNCGYFLGSSVKLCNFECTEKPIFTRTLPPLFEM